MRLATHVSVQLARFDALRTAGPAVAPPDGDTLFHAVGADCRAAGADPASGEGFTFLRYALHATEASARAALDAWRDHAPWMAEGRESWGAVLQPFRFFGEANHLDPSGLLYAGFADAPPADEPIVVITTAGWNVGPALDMERVRAFAQGVLGVRASMTGVDGLHAQQSFFFPGVFAHDPATFTMWRDFDAMRGFAYGPGSHRLQLDRHRAAPLSDRTSFTRFRLLRSEGTWYGAGSRAWAPRRAPVPERT